MTTDNDTKWHELTGFQRDLLKALLRLEDRHDQVSGQDIQRGLEQLQNIDVNHGRLYPNLDTLVDYDLVEKGTIDQRTNSYETTADGSELVRREVQSWVGLLSDGRQLAAGGSR